MKRIIGNIFVILVVVVIILMSVLLLSYNQFRVSQFGDTTLLIVDSKMMNYKKGSLLAVKSVEASKVKEGDYIFYYDTASQPVKTVLVQIKGKDIGVDKNDVDFILPDDSRVNSLYMIGTPSSTKEYEHIGGILGLLESKWGNLFLVVIPAFLLFMYELFNVILEFKVYNVSARR